MILRPFKDFACRPSCESHNCFWTMTVAALPLKLDAHDQGFGLVGKARSASKIACGWRLRVVGVACQVNARGFISGACIVFVTELGYIFKSRESQSNQLPPSLKEC